QTRGQTRWAGLNPGLVGAKPGISGSNPVNPGSNPVLFSQLSEGRERSSGFTGFVFGTTAPLCLRLGSFIFGLDPVDAAVGGGAGRGAQEVGAVPAPDTPGQEPAEGLAGGHVASVVGEEGAVPAVDGPAGRAGVDVGGQADLPGGLLRRVVQAVPLGQE